MSSAPSTPVTFACQAPSRGETDRASNPSAVVQKRTDRSISVTVKLVWLKPMIISCLSGEPISSPAAIHFENMACRIRCADRIK